MSLVRDLLEKTTQGLSFEVKKVNRSTVEVEIQGKSYTYKPVGMTVDELNDKLNKIGSYSAGKALAWLKKNAKVVKKS